MRAAVRRYNYSKAEMKKREKEKEPKKRKDKNDRIKAEEMMQMLLVDGIRSIINQ